MTVDTMELWYSPGFILEAADGAVTYCMHNSVKSTAELSKVLGEGRATAFFAMSLSKMHDAEVWMRLVDRTQEAPDAEIIYFDRSGKYQTMERLGVEVASYTKHSSEPLGEFVLRTKLNSHRAYGKHTALVFYIQKAMSGREVRQAHEHVAEAGVDGVVFLV